jgi:hypothetical protein
MPGHNSRLRFGRRAQFDAPRRGIEPWVHGIDEPRVFPAGEGIHSHGDGLTRADGTGMAFWHLEIHFDGVDRLQVHQLFSRRDVIAGTHTPETEDTGEGCAHCGLGEPRTRERQSDLGYLQRGLGLAVVLLAHDLSGP